MDTTIIDGQINNGIIPPINTVNTPTITVEGNALISLSTQDQMGNLVISGYGVWLTGFSTAIQTQFTSAQTQTGLVWSPVRRSEQMIQFTIDWPLQTTTGPTVKGTYNYNGFTAMNSFHNAIRAHQQLAATQGLSPVPMNFLYYNGFSGKFVDSNGNITNIPANMTESVKQNGTTTFSPYDNTLLNNNLSSYIDYSTKDKQGVYVGTSPVDKSLELQPIQYQGWIQSVGKEYDRFKAVYSMQYQMNVITPMEDTIDSTIFYNSDVQGIAKRLLPTQNNVFSQGSDWTRATISMSNGININGIPG